MAKAKTMTPCDNCIEIECEDNGYVCPLYKKYQDGVLERPQGKYSQISENKCK